MNNSLSADAARALAAFTALSPIEQLGSITSIKSPYSKTSSLRTLPTIDYKTSGALIINQSSSNGIDPAFGQFGSSGKLEVNGLRS